MSKLLYALHISSGGLTIFARKSASDLIQHQTHRYAPVSFRSPFT